MVYCYSFERFDSQCLKVRMCLQPFSHAPQLEQRLLHQVLCVYIARFHGTCLLEQHALQCHNFLAKGLNVYHLYRKRMKSHFVTSIHHYFFRCAIFGLQPFTKIV